MPLPKFLADLRRRIGHELVLVPTVVVLARDSADRILLVRDRDSDMWTLPGGIMEPGETPANAAMREVWEEARIRVTLAHLVGVVGGPNCETHYKNGDRIAWVATIFTATAMKGLPIADGDETVDARFFSGEDLSTASLRADTVRFLRVAHQGTQSAYFQPATWHPE